MRGARAAIVLSVACAATAGRAESEASGLTPGDIYERALRNLMRSAVVEFTLESFDAGGNSQRFELELMWMRFDQGSEEAAEGILSRALVRYLSPRDLRQTGVLAVNKRDEPDEQYVYLRSTRRVRRIRLQGENIFGTDFSVEDVIPRGFSHAEYRRVPDESVHDVPCHVVEARFKDEVEADYARGLFYVDRRHYVPLLVRYWNRAGVEVKQVRTRPDWIQELDGLHVPTRVEIHSVRAGAWTSLQMTRLVVNPALAKEDFSVTKLEPWATGATGIPNELYAGAHSFVSHATGGR